MKVQNRSAPGCEFDLYQSCAGGYHGAMVYQFLAAMVLLTHLGFILFVAAGALLVARRRRLLPLHLAAVAWGIAIEATGAACPLTGLENHLRMLAGTAGYAGGFVDHYLVGLIYPSGLTRTLQWGLAVGVLVLNVVLYARIVRGGRTGRD